ncbi:hypothetical protein GGTG_01359 [Gaeumannomyces tritici R3-111a-1]|uniref:Uncharacterized protein n=1 Tax=Gaeumannomyces tritici (strain R3-111a-1) TaxID=644352 RepID=J3NJC7_GAET3|nr:hypothetical protein GGTG_01359 [Gaeumannomyces tritici R3-111a-1]EJT81378.1 hypothetical protein GGTG_01359 [Gaeumannomyces tritici R3-111a-1]
MPVPAFLGVSLDKKQPPGKQADPGASSASGREPSARESWPTGSGATAAKSARPRPEQASAQPNHLAERSR